MPTFNRLGNLFPPTVDPAQLSRLLYMDHVEARGVGRFRGLPRDLDAMVAELNCQ